MNEMNKSFINVSAHAKF